MLPRASTRTTLVVVAAVLLVAIVGVTVARQTAAPAPATTSVGAPVEEVPETRTTASPVTVFPDASTTGVPVGTTLTPSGSITVTSDGAVLEDLDVSGSIQVRADDVTIRRSRIRTSGGTAVVVDPGTRGTLVEDVEIDGTGNTDGAPAVAYSSYTLRRVHIHHFGEGPRADGDVVIEDSYVHSFLDMVDAGAHQDVIQSTGGGDLVIRRNTLLMDVDGGNAVLMLGTSPGADVLFEGNLVAGGGYALYGGDSNGWTDVAFVDNRISTRYFADGGYWGPFVYADTARRSGNVWHESGLPVG